MDLRLAVICSSVAAVKKSSPQERHLSTFNLAIGNLCSLPSCFTSALSGIVVASTATFPHSAQRRGYGLAANRVDKVLLFIVHVHNRDRGTGPGFVQHRFDVDAAFVNRQPKIEAGRAAQETPERERERR